MTYNISTWYPTTNVQCASFKKALHACSPDRNDIYNNIQDWYSENLKFTKDDKDTGELAQFLMQYFTQVDSLLNLISACCLFGWMGRLLSCIGKYNVVLFSPWSAYLCLFDAWPSSCDECFRTRWFCHIESIEVRWFCFVKIRGSLHKSVCWPDTWAGDQRVITP